MDRIRSIISIARRQLLLAGVLDALAAGMVAAAVVAGLAVLAIKLLPGAQWSNGAFAALAGAALVLATGIVYAIRHRATPSEATLALRIDERLRLDERLTSALALERSTDAYARAAVADAVEKASDPALPARVRAAFPIKLGAHAFWAPALLALAAAAQVYLPAYEWPAEELPSTPVALTEKQLVEDSLERVQKEIEGSKALPQDVKDAMKGLAKNADPKVGGEPGESSDERREAIRRMSEVQKKLDEVRKGESARTNDALKRDLSELKSTEGETAKLTESLSKGDFGNARQELAELAKKMESGAMTDAEKDAFKASLENMAKSLENLAEKQQSMKDALEKAGLDAQLANNPEALKRAIEQAQGLSDQQRDELRKAAAAAKNSQQALKKFAGAAKKASEQRKPPANPSPKQQSQQQQQKQGGQQQQQGGQQSQQQQQQGGQQQQQGGQQSQQQQGGEPQSGEGQQGGEGAEPSLAELGEMLSELEVTEQMLQEAEALSNMADQESQSLGEGMCKGGGENPSGQSGAPNASPGQQRGQNGGRAQGGNTGKAKTPTGTKVEKAKSRNAGGDIIARQLIENPNPEVGESVLPSGTVGDAAEGGSGAAVSDDPTSAHLEETYKHYFGTMRRELAKKGAAGTGAPASGAGAPKSDAPTSGAPTSDAPKSGTPSAPPAK